MADEKEVNELLDQLLEGKTPEEIVGEGGLVNELTKRLMEQVLEGELTEHLGYEKHAPEGRDRGNSRNGRSQKRVRTVTRDLEIEVPRDREGSFDPKLVRKGQRHLPEFDEKVIALYSRGMTTREIQGHLKDLYQVEVSPELISTVTDAVLEDMRAWQARPLDGIYPIVYLDAIHVKLRASGHVQTQAIYVALAITLEGNKEFLGLWVGEAEGAKFWLSVLTELKNRGLKGHPDRRGRRAPGVPRGDRERVCEDAGPALHRASGPGLAPVRVLEGTQDRRPRLARHLPGADRGGGGTGP